MKVLMLGTNAPGGMSTLINLYLNSNIIRRYQIKFVPTHIEIIMPFLLIFFSYALIKSIYYFLHDDYKVVHMHISKGGSLLRKYVLTTLAKIFGKKILYHMHGGEFFEIYHKSRGIKKNLIKKMLSLPDIIIVLSERRKKEYAEIIDIEKLEVVYNFTIEPTTKINKQDKINIVYIGRLSQMKGSNVLIDACKLIEDLDFNLDMWGDGDLKRFRNRVHTLGIDTKVKIHGWLEQNKIDRILSSADIYVQPSNFEDLPISIIRALSHGLPVIGTRVGGIPEQVKHGYNGLIVEPGDISGLSNAMRALITDNKLRNKFGYNGKNVYRNNFTQEIIEEKIIQIYKSLEMR